MPGAVEELINRLMPTEVANRLMPTVTNQTEPELPDVSEDFMDYFDDTDNPRLTTDLDGRIEDMMYNEEEPITNELASAIVLNGD